MNACCNSYYNSHGPCIEHGNCFCHAETVGRISFFGDLAKAKQAMATINAGQRYKVEGDDIVIEHGSVRILYPDGRVEERRVTAARQDAVIHVQLGDNSSGGASMSVNKAEQERRHAFAEIERRAKEMQADPKGDGVDLNAAERLYNKWAANSGLVNWGDLIAYIPFMLAELRIRRAQQQEETP